MLQDYLAKECSLNHLNYQKDAMLAPHSTFGIGGHCDYFVTPFSETCLIELIAYLKKRQTRFIVIGNASNLLFDDHGFRGCVISTKAMRDVTVDGNVLTVSAGYSLIALSQLAAKHSLSGLEFACSIPGTVGGAIFMNAGAYGGEMKNIVTSCRYLTKEGIICETTDHDFSYRHSRYQLTGEIVLSCQIRLQYAEKDTILSRMQENKAKREATQPTKEKSAGSVFRRMEGIIPAKLIDEEGLKGLAVRGASVSEKHAGFIVNRSNASAKDVLMLIALIKKTIKDRYGVDLICEIQHITET